MKLNRTQICLSDKEQEFLKNKSEEMGISKAEFLRRIIDSYIEEENRGKDEQRSTIRKIGTLEK